MLIGRSRREKGNGIGCVIWLSGVGTTLGASSRLLRLDLDGLALIESANVSVRWASSAGGGARAASAAGSMTSASPSKNRVIAICEFQLARFSMGIAASSDESVTEVNCWRASCWSGVSEAMSKGGEAMVVSYGLKGERRK